MEKTIVITINDDSLERYNHYYFKEHPRAKKFPIKSPQHPSINTYTRMSFQAANTLKQKWKDFIVWLIQDMGYSGLMIQKCEVFYKTFFFQNRRHDLDNLSPKYILDGFVESGLIEDDDSEHIVRLTTECAIDKENPRIEFTIKILEM